MSTASHMDITDEFISRLIGSGVTTPPAAFSNQTHATLASDGSLGEVAAYSNQTHATLASDGSLGEVAAYSTHVTFAAAASHGEVPACN